MKTYNKKKHLQEAIKYKDKIGDRILHPERVEPEKRYLIKDDIRRVKRVLSLPFGKRVLDIGCSDGTVTFEIYKKWKCAAIVGIDIVPALIRKANRRLQQLNMQNKEKIKFLKTFIEDLSYPNEYFDTISACEVFEHLHPSRLELVLHKLTRMLKDSGNIIITLPNRSPDQKYILEKRDRWNWPTHYNYFTQSSLGAFLKKYFKKIKFYPLYNNESSKKSIYLICNCREKKNGKI